MSEIKMYKQTVISTACTTAERDRLITVYKQVFGIDRIDWIEFAVEPSPETAMWRSTKETTTGSPAIIEVWGDDLPSFLDEEYLIKFIFKLPSDAMLFRLAI